MPTREQVERGLALAKLGRESYEYFFDRLTSPAWLQPLLEAGAFKSPDGRIEKDGTVRFPSWPPARYLIRIAGICPEEVSAVISSTPETSNSRVHEEFISAIAKMPVEVGKRHVSSMLCWLDDSYLLQMPRILAEIIGNWFRAGFVDEPLVIASKLFSVTRRDRDAPEDLLANLLLGDSWEVLEILAIVSTGQSPKTKCSLIDILAQNLETAIGSKRATDAFYDLSHVWRPSVEESNQNGGGRPTDFYIQAIRTLSEEVGEQDETEFALILDKLRARKPAIFTRVMLHLLKTKPRHDLIQELFFDEKLFNADEVWHEYSLLLQKEICSFTPELKEKYFTFIEQAPIWWAKNEVDRKMHRYRYYYLLRDFLTEKATRQFNVLSVKFGELKNPTFSTFGELQFGHKSPKAASDLDGMSLGEIILFLREWTTSDDLGFGSSRSGLGRELQKSVARNPEKFASGISEFKLGLDSYVDFLIDGFRDALSENRKFSWTSLTDFLMWAVSDDQKGNGNDSASLSRVRMSVCRMLEKGFHSKENEIPVSLAGVVWEIICKCFSDPSPNSDNERDYTKDQNYYEVAINSVRGEALEAGIKFGLWAKKSGNTNHGNMISFLNLGLDIAKEKSLAFRSIYGRWFPWLLQIDQKWCIENTKIIFPEGKDKRNIRSAAWNAYIQYVQPFNDVFPFLQNEYLYEVKRLGAKAGSKSDKITHLLDHLIVFYLRGIVQLNDPCVDELFKSDNLESRATAIEIVGRKIKSSTSSPQQVPSVVIDRAKALWESRINFFGTMHDAESCELSPFGWWLPCNELSRTWRLEQTLGVLKRARAISPYFYVLPFLSAAADEEQVRVAEILDLMVRYQDDSNQIRLWCDDAFAILEKLVKTDLKTSVAPIVDIFIAKGFRQFKQLLK